MECLIISVGIVPQAQIYAETLLELSKIYIKIVSLARDRVILSACVQRIKRFLRTGVVNRYAKGKELETFRG